MRRFDLLACRHLGFVVSIAIGQRGQVLCRSQDGVDFTKESFKLAWIVDSAALRGKHHDKPALRKALAG